EEAPRDGERRGEEGDRPGPGLRAIPGERIPLPEPTAGEVARRVSRREDSPRARREGEGKREDQAEDGDRVPRDPGPPSIPFAYGPPPDRQSREDEGVERDGRRGERNRPSLPEPRKEKRPRAHRGVDALSQVLAAHGAGGGARNLPDARLVDGT